MKQVLFLIIIVVIGYFIFQGGAGRVLSKANINTKGLITDITQSVDENYVPDLAPERSHFKTTNSESLNLVKNTVFLTYDPETCFSLIDIVYSSGSDNALPLINEYLTMFNLTEDRAKVLNLLSQYKDKQTLKMLVSLYKNGSLGRVNLLNVMSSYHTPQVAQLIHQAVTSPNETLAQTAKKLENQFAEEKWYKNGLETKVVDEEKANANNAEGQIAQMF